MTCTLSVVVMHKHPSRQEVTALVVLTLGVMLAVWQVRWAGPDAPALVACWAFFAPAGPAVSAPSGNRKRAWRQRQRELDAQAQPPPPLQGTVSGKPYAICFCIAGTICNGAMVRALLRVLGCFWAVALVWGGDGRAEPLGHGLRASHACNFIP